MGEVIPAIKSNSPWALRLSSHWHSDAPILEHFPWELFLRLEQTPVGGFFFSRNLHIYCTELAICLF